MEETIKLSDLTHFTEKQLLATRTADEYDYTLFGGAAGPGKSYWLRWNSVRQLIKWGKEFNLKGIHGALFSEDYPTLKDRQISKMEVEFPRWLGEIKNTITDGLGFHLNEEYGGHVLMLRNLDDPSKYLSSEFALIAVEELTMSPEQKFHLLRGRMRWTGIPRPKFFGATNPGNIGHLWVKQRWIDKKFPAEEMEISKQFAYVPALPTDNPHLAKSYIETLKSLPERLRKAYLEGNWDIFEGQYFTEWDKTRHVVPPFPVPLSFKRFRAYDHGRTNAACCKWYALDYDGRVWVYKELYVKGLNVDQIAEQINKMSVGETYEYSVADPAIFAKMGFVDRYGGQTIAETFAHYGIMFLPASNRRIDGWNLMHQYLHWEETKPPKIIYFNTCFDSIRTIPALVHDTNKPEDIDSRGEDHAADVDRYLLMSLHERKTKKPLTEVERKLEELKNANNYGSNDL
jgi:phage terminase large subunit